MHRESDEFCKLSDGYILFSEAIRRLEMRIWGGLRDPRELRNLKDALRKEESDTVTIETDAIRKGVSVGFGPRRQEAGKRLTRAALGGKLGVYLARQDQKTPGCTRIPCEVLERLMLVRGSLPDYPIRPSIKACSGDRSLALLLRTGPLVVEESEFNRWVAAERNKGRWPSQRSRKKPRTGRPTKATGDLRDALLELIRVGAWNSTQPITELRHWLIMLGKKVPSADTLIRLVNSLYVETGDPALRRRKRAPRRRSE